MVVFEKKWVISTKIIKTTVNVTVSFFVLFEVHALANQIPQ